MEYRRATLFDISAILALLTEMEQEATGQLRKVNWVKVTGNLLDCIGNGVVFVATEDRRIVGSIGGRIAAEWYTDSLVLGDLWFYVHPDHRKTPAAKQLLIRFRDIASENNMDIQVGHLFDGQDTSRKDSFFESCGFQKVGTVYKEKDDGRTV